MDLAREAQDPASSRPRGVDQSRNNGNRRKAID
jgi:hypothetical protein